MSLVTEKQKVIDYLDNIYKLAFDRELLLKEYFNATNLFFQKKKLPQYEYLDQLEKNVPYHKFLYENSLSVFCSYVFSLDKKENDDNLFGYLFYCIKDESKPQTRVVLNYLQTSEDNLNMTNDFKHLKNLKNLKQYKQLFEELEFQINYHMAYYESSCFYYSHVINDINLCKFISSSYKKAEFSQIIDKYITTSAKILLKSKGF